VHGFGGAQCARLRQCKASTEVPAECGRRFGGGDRLLEGSGGHWRTASAVHSAHGFGSARRVLRYRPNVAAASAGATACLRAAEDTGARLRRCTVRTASAVQGEY